MCVFCDEEVESLKSRSSVFGSVRVLTNFDQQIANDDQQRSGFPIIFAAERKSGTVDYLIVIGTLLMVGLYAVLVGWLLPKH